MLSIALALFIVFIVYVMIWSIRNDDARSISDQTGIIRMRDSGRMADRRRGHAGHQYAPEPAPRGRKDKIR